MLNPNAKLWVEKMLSLTQRAASISTNPKHHSKFIRDLGTEARQILQGIESEPEGLFKAEAGQ